MKFEMLNLLNRVIKKANNGSGMVGHMYIDIDRDGSLIKSHLYHITLIAYLKISY